MFVRTTALIAALTTTTFFGRTRWNALPVVFTTTITAPAVHCAVFAWVTAVTCVICTTGLVTFTTVYTIVAGGFTFTALWALFVATGRYCAAHFTAD